MIGTTQQQQPPMSAGPQKFLCIGYLRERAAFKQTLQHRRNENLPFETNWTAASYTWALQNKLFFCPLQFTQEFFPHMRHRSGYMHLKLSTEPEMLSNKWANYLSKHIFLLDSSFPAHFSKRSVTSPLYCSSIGVSFSEPAQGHLDIGLPLKKKKKCF